MSETTLIVMHEGSYSDQSWNTYEVPNEDVDAFVGLAAHFRDADVQAVFPNWAGAWTFTTWEDGKRCEPRRVPLTANPPEHAIATEAYGITEAAAAAKLTAVEFEYAKKCFAKVKASPYSGAVCAKIKQIFGITIAGFTTA